MQALRHIENDSDDIWPGLPARGWSDVFRLAAPSAGFHDYFNRLSFDPYAPNAQRYRRFTQFIGFFDRSGTPVINRLPHEPFVQSAKFNSLSGGILRELDPIEDACDVSPYIRQIFDQLNVDKTRKYHLDVHMYRVYGKPGVAGNPVPEGMHRDGMEAVAILVLKRQGITAESAKFSLIDPHTKEAFFSTVVGEGEGIILDDQKMLHDAQPVIASGDEPGYRDYIVVNINRWENRRYGREHKLLAMGDKVVLMESAWDRAKRERRITRANEAFEEMMAAIDAHSPYAVQKGRNLDQRIANLQGHDALAFTPDDLLTAKKAALVLRANHDAAEARRFRREGRYPMGPLHRIYTGLAELRDLKGGEEPDRADGLTFGNADLIRYETEPRLWALKRRAETDPRIHA